MEQNICKVCHREPAQEGRKTCLACREKLSGSKLKRGMSAEELREGMNRRKREARLRVKVETIEHYGGKCSCCGEYQMDALCIDHVNGNGNKQRKEQTWGIGGYATYVWLREYGWPEGYQVLCFNCNQSKHLNGNTRCRMVHK